MLLLARAISIVAVVALAGCASSSYNTSDIGPTLHHPGTEMQPIMQPAALPPPGQQVAMAQSMTDVTSFLDPQVQPLLSEKERSEASSAQFNALQFGRAGAPRAWQGDRGANGNVVVGPPVNVNNLYCRTFTHTVTVSGQPYAKQGMACRELDGSWNVVGA